MELCRKLHLLLYTQCVLYVLCSEENKTKPLSKVNVDKDLIKNSNISYSEECSMEKSEQVMNINFVSHNINTDNSRSKHIANKMIRDTRRTVTERSSDYTKNTNYINYASTSVKYSYTNQIAPEMKNKITRIIYNQSNRSISITGNKLNELLSFIEKNNQNDSDENILGEIRNISHDLINENNNDNFKSISDFPNETAASYTTYEGTEDILRKILNALNVTTSMRNAKLHSTTAIDQVDVTENSQDEIQSTTSSGPTETPSETNTESSIVSTTSEELNTSVEHVTNEETTHVEDISTSTTSNEFTSTMPSTVEPTINVTVSTVTPITDESTTSSDILSTTLQTTTYPTSDNGSNSAEPPKDEINAFAIFSESVGPEWIVVSWENLPQMSNDTDISVFVNVCEIDSCSNNTIIDKIILNKYNISKLNPCTEYNITIKISIEQNEFTGTINETTTDNIVHLPGVRKLQTLYSGNSFIKLTWEPAAEYRNCITRYEILRCGKKCVTSFQVLPEYQAIDLEECSDYNFTVKAIANKVESAGTNITGRTKSPKLSEPRSAIARPDNSTDEIALIVNWEPPNEGTMCIKHYRITIEPKKETMFTQDTNITITNLNACTKYNIYINAVDKDNGDGTLVTINALTVANAPTLSAHKPMVYATNISIFWTIKSEGNNTCQTAFMTTFCNYTETYGHGYEVLNGVSKNVIEVESALSINITVDNLSPYTAYECWSVIENEAGNSSMSAVVNVTTLEDYPSAPLLNVTNITNSEFDFVWNEPEYLAGNLTQYEIILSWNILYPIPDWCNSEIMNSDNITIYNATLSSFKYSQANPFTNYTAKIRAKTAAGWSNYSDSIIFQSEYGVPSPATNFSYAIGEVRHKPQVINLTLKWALPCALNGIINYFNITVTGTRTGFKLHSFFEIKNISNHVNKNDTYTLAIDNLRGEYNYTIQIYTKVIDTETLGLPANCSGILYPAGIPPQPDEDYVRSISIDPYKARRSPSTATVLLPLFPNTNGDIRYYAIMISEMGYNIASENRFNLKEYIWPNVSSWEESKSRDFTIPYQATRPEWDPYPTYVADYGHIKAVKYVVGEDTTCREISSNSDKRLYCNGPLKPDTWYHIRMRAFTNNGYADSSSTFVIKTDAELNIAIVIGVVFGILFLGILTTMMLLVRKCSPQAMLRRFLHADMPGSPVPAPFTRKKFISHCQQLADNPGKLSNEFRLLQTLSVDLQMPANTACLQANRKKNRYSDILPYDFSRVKLEVIDNDPNTDYINASFIRGYTGEDEYIACQGPKEETTYDFWRMIDQYDVKTVIMLTQLIERGKEKCHQYFPTIGESFRYEKMNIRCSSELDFRTYTQRTLIIQKDTKKRNITHLHFKDWPDHDVPEDFDPMINFCQIMRRSIAANKGTVVIHCSAGIGRTGTLIAIDILLQHLRDNRKLDVFGTVYRLRHDRINMVQRESQYAYIYNCIKQVLKNPYFLKTYKPPPVDAISDNQSKKVSQATMTFGNANNANVSEVTL